MENERNEIKTTPPGRVARTKSANRSSSGSLSSINLDDLALAPVFVIDLDDDDDDDDDYDDDEPTKATTTTKLLPSQTIKTTPLSSPYNNKEEKEILPNTSSDAMKLALDGLVYTTSVEIDQAEATVVAPSDLSEESILRIAIGNDKIIVVQVPSGGVTKGETFSCAYRMYKHTKPSPSPPNFKKAPPDHYHLNNYICLQQNYNSKWNSGICDCCKFGPCHQSFIGAFCCNCVLLAQVMTRMNLNHLGKKDDNTRSIYRHTVTRIFIVFAFYYMIRAVLLRSLIVSLTPVRNDENGDKNENYDTAATATLLGVGFALDILILGYALLLLVRTRKAVRERYSITSGGVVDSDCCKSLCCYCCTLSQLARQSADYEHRDAKWCTVTGVSTEFDEEYGLYAPVSAVSSSSMERGIV